MPYFGPNITTTLRLRLVERLAVFIIQLQRFIFQETDCNNLINSFHRGVVVVLHLSPAWHPGPTNSPIFDRWGGSAHQ